ncbi:TPA: hypothetical protein ACHJFD_005197, partial [Escherichia coli]
YRIENLSHIKNTINFTSATAWSRGASIDYAPPWHHDRFTDIKKPPGGVFKLCGEVTHLYQVFGNKITCGVLIFMPIK